MKSNEDVRMISAEAPVLFAKAVEMFILELSIRSWCYSEKFPGKRNTLHKEDLQTMLRRTEAFDFLYGVEDISGRPHPKPPRLPLDPPPEFPKRVRGGRSK